MRVFLTVLIAALVSGESRGQPWLAVSTGDASPATNTAGPPHPLSARTPVDYLRELLAMTPEGREQALQNRSPQSRKFLEERIQFFEGLAPAERESRMQTLQLRWRMLPLMRLQPSERGSALSTIPESDRLLVEQRLAQWDGLTDDLKSKVLENEHFLRFFFRSEETQTTPEAGSTPLTPEQVFQRDREQDRWLSLSETERGRILSEFQALFELSAKEKARILGGMGEAERRQMERALQAYSRLPREQRDQCLLGFQKFASLSERERKEFMENADRWRTLSAEDRRLWRDMVNRLQLKAILPPGYRPLTPPHPSATAVRRPGPPQPPPPPLSGTATATLHRVPAQPIN